MNISQVASLTQLSAKSIRFYEQKGVIAAPSRSDNGYRQYTQAHVDALLILAKAKRVGFSLEECKALINLAMSENRTSAAVKAKAEQKLIEVTDKIDELVEIKVQLERWVDACPGDAGQACPIIDELQGSVIPKSL